jgi:para-aminobenzoate synthetase component 1
MKGTRPRHHDPNVDRVLAEELARDPKERAENVMAVDVMRNDLSRVAASRSVHVEELCAGKTYPAVHQMVSTVSADLRGGVHPVEAVRAAWPMASMTGAPKVRAMQLIDEIEDQRRGLYSGSIGYFDPDGVMDLNVVIRTVLHDVTTAAVRSPREGRSPPFVIRSGNGRNAN